MHWPPVARSLALSALAAFGSGCADAAERFQAFEERRTVTGSDGAGGSQGGSGGAKCAPPAPGVVHGRALLALETATSPGIAILFLGELTTPELAGQTAVRFEYRALDQSDRATEVGDELVVGPYPIGGDGSFDAPTEASTLPGSANAILPGAPITSQLTLHGTICGVADFYCGTVTGTVTSPIKAETNGHFGITLLGDDELPARPRYGCAADALAPALP